MHPLRESLHQTRLPHSRLPDQERGKLQIHRLAKNRKRPSPAFAGYQPPPAAAYSTGFLPFGKYPLWTSGLVPETARPQGLCATPAMTLTKA
ncbi:MAG: hypothetical protein WED15_06655 [Akkermansiaceae bacterium]